MTDEATARKALKTQGIVPNPALIKNWIRAAKAEQQLQRQSATAPPPSPPTQPAAQPQAPSAKPEDCRPKHHRGYSKSRLGPVLREEGTLERPRGSRKPGRPRIIASWFSKVAETMADGTSLQEALTRHGITLVKSQIRALYRNVEFRRTYLEARRRH